MLDLGPDYLPAFILNEVLPQAPVRPAKNIHGYLFTLARVLLPWRSEEQIYAALRCYGDQCGRHVPESEIRAAIRRARAYAWLGHTGGNGFASETVPRPPPRPKAKFDLEIFRRFIAGVGRIDAAWLAARSPIRPDNRTPASFLHPLYRKGEKVVIFDNFQSQG
jgi:hypothetical protein